MEGGELRHNASVITRSEEEGEEAVRSVCCFHQRIPERARVKVRLPPGYRFVPKDSELVMYYLSKKVAKEPTPYDQIQVVDIYKYNPQELSEKYPDFGDNEWYFFTPRDRRYPNGSRPNRAAGNGYWKATGADKHIRHNNEVIGCKKSLVFLLGKSPKGDKTDWIMHEYVIDQPPKTRTRTRTRTDAEDMKLDCVLCKIYKKPLRFTKNGKQPEPVSENQEVVIPVPEPVTGIPEETHTALIPNQVEDTHTALIPNQVQDDNLFRGYNMNANLRIPNELPYYHDNEFVPDLEFVPDQYYSSLMNNDYPFFRQQAGFPFRFQNSMLQVETNYSLTFDQAMVNVRRNIG